MALPEPAPEPARTVSAQAAEAAGRRWSRLGLPGAGVVLASGALSLGATAPPAAAGPATAARTGSATVGTVQTAITRRARPAGSETIARGRAATRRMLERGELTPEAAQRIDAALRALRPPSA